MVTKEKLLSFALELTAATAALVRRRAGAGADIGRRLDHINKSGDRQVALDKLLDDYLIDRVSRAAGLPSFILVSEETGVRRLGPAPEHFILLDPVDGSNNLRPWPTPCPALAVSVAVGSLDLLAKHGDERALLVTANRDIFGGCCYHAVAGAGAYFTHGRRRGRLGVSPGGAQPPVIGVDLDLASALPPALAGLLTERVVARRLGSSILDLCCVAAGQYDGYLSLGRRLKITDIAQSALLVREAGGIFAKQAYRDGEPAPGLENDHLSRLLLDGETDLLSQVKFSVLAAGTEDIYQRLAAVGGDGFFK